jgi:hypothetical protein
MKGSQTGQAHSVWMQHVLGIVDMPFRDVDNPLKEGEDRLKDHIQKRPTLIDDSRKARNLNVLATASTAPAMTQQIVSTFPCLSGTKNAPPQFFTTSSPATATRDIKTEFECVRTQPCIVDLHIIDYVMRETGLQDGLKISTDEIQIEEALGELETQGSLINLQVNGETTETCKGKGRLSCRFQLQGSNWNSDLGYFRPEGVGDILVQCFIAVDKHSPSTCQSGAGTACTCRSLPLCLKFKIVGQKPQFVHPTPLEENSLDDHGTLVQGRTDVAACEGYEMVLPLVATDEDPFDQVRIFVQDFDVDNKHLVGGEHDLYRLSGGKYNPDFFSISDVVPKAPNEAQHCGSFNGYRIRDPTPYIRISILEFLNTQSRNSIPEVPKPETLEGIAPAKVCVRTCVACFVHAHLHRVGRRWPVCHRQDSRNPDP